MSLDASWAFTASCKQRTNAIASSLDITNDITNLYKALGGDHRSDLGVK